MTNAGSQFRFLPEVSFLCANQKDCGLWKRDWLPRSGLAATAHALNRYTFRWPLPLGLGRYGLEMFSSVCLFCFLLQNISHICCIMLYCYFMSRNTFFFFVFLISNSTDKQHDKTRATNSWLLCYGKRQPAYQGTVRKCCHRYSRTWNSSTTQGNAAKIVWPSGCHVLWGILWKMQPDFVRYSFSHQKHSSLD